MLDRDLAVPYGVETRALNQAVKRNSDRFPPDLAFQVDFGEVTEAIGRSVSAEEGSRSQFVTLNKGRGGNIKWFLCPMAIEKFNQQNPTLSVRTTEVFHDRFLILDGKELYHFGASLKDLGRLYCAVSKMDAGFIPSILARI